MAKSVGMARAILRKTMPLPFFGGVWIFESECQFALRQHAKRYLRQHAQRHR